MPHYIPFRVQPQTHVYNPIQHNQGELPTFDTKKTGLVEDFRYLQPAANCYTDNQSYFSPSYLPMPINYNTRQPHWTDTRITKDWIAQWGNELIRHDRAFGAWHVLYGTTYLYGDNRRL